MIRRLALAVALTLVLLGTDLRAACAQYPSGEIDRLNFSPRVSEGLEAIDSEHYVKAREIADDVFARDPESFQSWYLMGAVMWYCESNLPRAQYYFNGARDRIEKANHGEKIPQSGPWYAHCRTLIDLIWLDNELEDYTTEIDLLDVYQRLYRPSKVAMYAWPLMKLGRFKEARDKIGVALATMPNSEDEVTQAYNSLGAIEGEQDNIQKSYEIFLQLIDVVKQHNWTMDSTYFFNAAEQGIILHKFTDAEKQLIEGTRYFDPRTYTNPYYYLAQLYVSSGRLMEAFTAVRKMHQWSHACEPHIEQQNWNEHQQMTAATLLAAGYDLDALALMRRTLNRPDRRGSNSVQPDETEIASLTLYRELLKSEQQRYNEHLSWCTWREWFALQAARLENAREIWAVTSRVAAVIMANGRLDWALRPYAVDSRIWEWFRPVMHEIIGDGVVSVEAQKLLARTDDVGVRERPYLLVSLGEADASRGYVSSAIRYFTDALKPSTSERPGLPEAEVLLRARVTALLAECYERQGEMDQAVICYRQAMEKDPHLIRSLNLALPVSIENDGSAAASIAAGWLRHSPRFNDVGSGFVVRVGASGSGLSASLLYPDGTVFVTTSVDGDADPRTLARHLCQEFHSQAFMPHLDLSQTDINSLDGSNETGDIQRKQLLQSFGVADPTASPSP